MSRFRFTLDSLLRYRRHRRDLVVSLLAQVLAEDRKLEERQVETESDRTKQIDELRTLAVGAVDIDRSASRRYYAGLLSGMLQSIAANRKVVGEQLELCRKALMRADQDVKLLERLREKQLAEHEQVEERRAGREREEAWMAAHWTEFRT